MSRLPRAHGWPSVLLVLLLALAFRLWDLHAAGETLDEPDYAGVGESYIQALWRLDLGEAAWAGNHEHPPIAKYVYGVAGLLGPEAPLRAGRVASALMGALTCLLLVLLGTRLFDRPTGVLAGLILAFLPTVVAHNKVLGLETPSMLLVTATLLAAVAAAEDPRNSRTWLMAGLLAGLAVGVRLNNLLVFLPLIALSGESYMATHPPSFWIQPRNLLLLPLISGLVFVGSFPWLWTGHWTYDIREFFLGVYRTPPVSYYAVYFLATTPVGVLLASAAFGLTWKRTPRLAGL
ncbi:MAG: glycosyltransferase family 39 protein, partial [Deltaproteobacteria bacterium]|nr:glycosyltransferase family 39 protein [Deltaproteobacteria bacterium]